MTSICGKFKINPVFRMYACTTCHVVHLFFVDFKWDPKKEDVKRVKASQSSHPFSSVNAVNSVLNVDFVQTKVFFASLDSALAALPGFLLTCTACVWLWPAAADNLQAAEQEERPCGLWQRECALCFVTRWFIYRVLKVTLCFRLIFHFCLSSLSFCVGSMTSQVDGKG